MIQTLEMNLGVDWPCDPSVRQHLDSQIEYHRLEIKRLEGLKERNVGLLERPWKDAREAMK